MRRAHLLIGCLALGVLLAAAAAQAVPGKIVIRNLDGAGEGFNLGTAAAPVGGNAGTTVGGQRLNVFQHAADIWGAILQNTDTIYVNSRFDSLTCGPSSAVLGSAGPTSIFRDFGGAVFSGTWYHAALANQLAGSRISSASAGQIAATFNSELDGDPACLGGKTWYYGYDGNEGSLFELLPVVLHELGHGLGFSTSTNGSSGAYTSGFPSAFDHFLYDSTTHRVWSDPSETAGQRAASAVGGTLLLWSGSAVNYGVTHLPLTAGFDAANRPFMYTPGAYSAGSSVSHWDASLSPNTLMEPALSASLSSTVDLTKHAFVDLGWLPISTPTALASFTAEDFETGVLLQWQFADPSDIATLTVQRATDDAGPWTALTTELFTRDGRAAAMDGTVAAGTTYYYRLNVIDLAGHERNWGMTSVFHSGITAGPATLFAPGPNPTPGGTTVAFRLPRPEFVRVEIVDATGRRVRTLQDGALAPGEYQRWWDGASAGGRVAPGLYFATLRTSEGLRSQRIAVIR
jgi:hypothetical protein